MSAAGILRDFQTLISNAGLEHFVDGEPHQYAKLTMSMVGDFRFSWSLPNPMVHYKIYNKTVDLPFYIFCAAIKVPKWGLREKIKERPRLLMDLYEEICQGRNFSDESGKLWSIFLKVNFGVFISHLFDILPILLPSLFLLGRLQASYPLMI
jgi:hypothetical protein